MELLIFLLVIFFMALYGGIKTFQRNWMLALFLLIFLTVIWSLWALVECFTGPITPDVVNDRVDHNNTR